MAGIAVDNLRGIARLLFRLLILALVGWGILACVRKAAVQLSDQRTSLLRHAEELELLAGQCSVETEAEVLRSQAVDLRRQVRDYWKADWRFLLMAGVVYGMSLVPAATYWQNCLKALGQQVPIGMAFWAYFYGNLGKYVPGKAMVVVLRLASLAPLGVRRVATTLSIFIETLTMMSVGAFVAAVCLLLLNLDWRITVLASAGVVATSLPIFPPLLRYLLVRLQPGVEPQELSEWAERMSWGLVLRGWATLGLTWVGFGLSLACVLYSLPTATIIAVSPAQFWLSVMGATALAVVIGFVSMIPGGAGVREVVLSMVLAPVVGPTASLSCAIWLRVIWLIVELFLAAVFYFFRYSKSTVR